MIAAADTSPLCYLILIGEIDLLAKLFSRVVVPTVVIAELCYDDAPHTVRAWAVNPPPWVTVTQSPPPNTADMDVLQAGEQSAILLAESIKADVLLVDEKAARRVATDHGLRVTGTLGVLSEAAARGLIDLPTAINRLRQTNFRYSPVLLKAVLDRFSSKQSR
jgi:predicted nucleic acid-binding protein